MSLFDRFKKTKKENEVITSNTVTKESLYNENGYDSLGFDKNGFNLDGYDINGFDMFGYDINGYDKNGYNRFGFDKNGFDCNGLNRQGYNRQGFNLDGRDKNGYDRNGFNQDGFDHFGYNSDGYNIDGFDMFGYDKNGLDKDGYTYSGFNILGYDRYGFNKAGYNTEGYNREGFNYKGFNCKGFDRNGFDENGYDVEGYNQSGFDKKGYDREGYDFKGYSAYGYNRFGYDKEGYNGFGYDKNGFNKEGYTFLGFDREGYNRAGYNAEGYDREGYDFDGFNIYGYTRFGYDKEGFDKFGYCKEGYNREGRDRNGYDRKGYDSAGFNIYGYDHFGYDINGYNEYGFDCLGYDKEGYSFFGINKAGYNRLGFDESGYDRCGFDLEGYNTEGYNQNGYDRNGFDRNGYDIEGYDFEGYNAYGYNRFGYDKEGYNGFGYDKNGFNIEGFSFLGIDREGYNRAGYNTDGYDRNGFDENGFNQNGFDKDGFDKLGYDKDGYNREGFDRSGFNENGLDKDGYDKFGYDEKGYNREGYDKYGYDRKGFNINGFDFEGYDRKGFDQTGFNRKGYDKDGFNKSGYDADGYNRDGYNKRGFDRNNRDKEGYSQFGFDDYGLDREGYDVQGYDKYGFNKDGYDREGFNTLGSNEFGHFKNEYDLHGFLISTGFNDEGFDQFGRDRSGFDRNGYDQDGYNKLGFNHDGYNREGFDEEGYRINGFDKNGFDAEGYNEQGFDKQGYDREGFDAHGFNIDGYDSNGYDKEGFDEYGYNSDGLTKEDFEKLLQQAEKLEDLKKGDIVFNDSYGKLTFQKMNTKTVYFLTKNNKEVKYRIKDAYKHIRFQKTKEELIAEKNRTLEEFSEENELLRKTISYARDYYFPKLNKVMLQKAKEKFIKYGIQTGIGTTDANDAMFVYEAEQNYNKISNQITNKPYHGKVMVNDKPYYIGKNRMSAKYVGLDAIPYPVYDWTDPESAYYYQYKMYLGDKHNKISIVRDYRIANRELLDYFDKYREDAKNELLDDYMAKVLYAYRKDKSVHDIIESIEGKQYEIMSQPKELPFVVLGCAGSGKTMILFHRLKYLLNNNKDVDIKDCYLLSPTEYLSKEMNPLANELNLTNANRVTAAQYLFETYREYFIKQELYNPINRLNLKNVYNPSYNKKYFNQDYLDKISNKVKKTIQGKKLKNFAQEERMKLNESLNVLVEPLKKEKEQSLEDLMKSFNNLVVDYYKEIEKYSNKNVEYMMESIVDEKSSIKDISFLKQVLEFFLDNRFFYGKDDKEAIKEFSVKIKEEKNDRKKIKLIRKELGSLWKFMSEMKDDFDEIKKGKYNSLHDIFVHVVQSSSKLMNKDSDYIMQMLDEFYTYSRDRIKRILKVVDSIYKDYEELEYEYSILKDLVEKGLLTKVDYRNEDNEIFGQTKESYKEMHRTFRLYKALNWTNGSIDSNVNWSIIADQPEKYCDVFRNLKQISEQLTKFEEGDWKKYFYYIVQRIVNPKHQYYSLNSIMNYDSLALYDSVLNECFGSLDEEKRYVFVDEFQDLSISELKILSNSYPNSIFNYYGDLRQCINPKGIHDNKELYDCFGNIKTFEILENYRNAKQITEFVNKKVHTNMRAIGVNGKLFKSIDYNDIPENLKVAHGDRLALIVKDISSIDKRIVKKLRAIPATHEEQEKIKNRERIMIYTVQEAKGLEFETVIVDEKGMDLNQIYVSTTRALNKLFIIN